MTGTVHHSRQAGPLRRVLHVAEREFLAVIPPTLFFFVGFNLILFSKRLFLSDNLAEYAGFLLATTGALIVGKVVLVADKMPFLKRFDYAPLAYPILFKTLVYTLLVFVARLLEALVHYLVDGGVLGGGRFVAELMGRFSWSRFSAIQVWIFVLFVVYVTASEINDLLGDGELFKIFFTRHSSVTKAVRRARIRQVVRLARLTEANSIETLRQPGSAANAELFDIVRALTRNGRA